MREFNLYIDVTRKGTLAPKQKEQFLAIMDALQDIRVNLFWIPESTRITIYQIREILRNVRCACKDKNIIIHNEIHGIESRVSGLKKWLLDRSLVSVYYDKRFEADSYNCLAAGNTPKGCIFGSCLGHTAYLMKDSEISLCPEMKSVRLAKLDKGESLGKIFETDDFRTTIQAQIQRRNKCKSDCELFGLCHGGCPRQINADSCDIIQKVNSLEISDADIQIQNIKHLANMYRG